MLRTRIPARDGVAAVDWLRRSATLADDPGSPPLVSASDPGDDYLLALALSERAALVSGDGDLLSLAGEMPIYSPAEFLRVIAAQGRGRSPACYLRHKPLALGPEVAPRP